MNYVKPTDMNMNPSAAKKPAGIGPDMGLTVLLNLSKSDYFYPLKNFIGANILIFDPQEFADAATGGVREGLKLFLITSLAGLKKITFE